MAHKKGGGSSRNKKNHPIGKRLGTKKTHLEHILPGQIIVRQRGTKIFPGKNVGLGRDHTCFSKAEGYVFFSRKKGNVFVSVIPTDALVEQKA